VQGGGRLWLDREKNPHVGRGGGGGGGGRECGSSGEWGEKKGGWGAKKRSREACRCFKGGDGGSGTQGGEVEWPGQRGVRRGRPNRCMCFFVRGGECVGSEGFQKEPVGKKIVEMVYGNELSDRAVMGDGGQ